MTASSGFTAGDHARWTMGPPGRVGEKMEHGVGSLSSQDASEGWAREHWRLIWVPSGAIDAIVPSFEHEILLRQASEEKCLADSGSEARAGLTYRQHPRLRISSTRCCNCLVGGRVAMGRTSSPNRSSSMFGMAAPKGPIWSSSIMGILEEVICERRLLPGPGRRTASDRWLLVRSAWG